MTQLTITNYETWIMTLRSSDLQSDSDLDSIRNSCDVFIFKWITEMKSKPRVINVSRFRIRDLKLSNHVTKLNYLPIKRKQNYLWNRYIHVSQGWWKWLLLFLAALVSLQNWLHIKKGDDKLKSALRHWRCSWQAGVGGQWFN